MIAVMCVGVGGWFGRCAWVRVVEDGMAERACFPWDIVLMIESLYPVCLRNFVAAFFSNQSLVVT